MAQPFSNTTRSLEADTVRPWLLAAAATIVVLAVWSVWFAMARLPLYAVSATARLEVSEAVHPIEAPLDGRVQRVAITLGQTVHAGDLLIALDSEAQALQLAEGRVRLEALGPQIERITPELQALERTSQQAASGTTSAIQEAQARLRDAETATRLAREEAARVETLHAQGLVPEIELVRARSARERSLAVEDSIRQDLERQRSEHLGGESDLQGRTERLRRELAALQGQVLTEKAAIARLSHEVDERTIRAPLDGRVGEIAELKLGQFVKAGARLAAIVPSGELKTVTYFSPSEALGRVRVGQSARVRLEGFPWLQYGSIPARVVNVADEPRDGVIRVELTLQPGGNSRLPIQHGMPASAEIEIGSISPAGLVLRTAGDLLRGAPDADDTGSSATRAPR